MSSLVTIARRQRLSRVSGRQVELLWEFLNSNRDLAHAHNRSLHAKEYSQKKWKEIAEQLNAQVNGTQKNWRGWSKYWVDYKAKLKIRVAALQTHAKTTGSIPAVALTDIEKKFLEILYEVDKSLSRIELLSSAEPPYSKDRSAAKDSDMQDSQPLESVIQSVQPTTDTTPRDPLTSSPYIPSPFPQLIVTPLRTTANPSETPSPEHRRRKSFTSREATRRALVRSSKMRGEAAMRTSVAIEKMVQHMAELQNTALRIEKILTAAFPSAAQQVNGTHQDHAPE